MKNSKGVWLVAVAVTVFCFSLQLVSQDSFAQSVNLVTSSSEAQFPATMERSVHNYWDNGYFITIPGIGAMVPDKPGVILYGKDGGVVRQATIWLDGATNVSVRDAAVSPSGNLVVSGWALSQQGAVATFIAEIGADDQIHRLIRTTPFTVASVCALDDGTVWAYGFDRDAHDNLVETSPRLRQYSFDKGQLRAVLDPSTLPDAEASRNWHLYGGRYVGEVNFRCNANEVVVFNGETGDLVEFDLRKNTLRLTKVASLGGPPDFHITGFVLTNSGNMFLSFHDRSQVKPEGISGLLELAKDSSGKAKWVAVAGSSGRYLKDSPIQKLWGADGDTLVYSRSKDGRLYWSK